MKLGQLVGVCLLLSGTVSADPTVTLLLTSSQSGQRVVGGMSIDWTIRVAVSTDDNAGLVLIGCDLIQRPTNPAFCDLSPADLASIDAAMDDFSRPLGISNPGEGGAPTGYIGVQRSPAGQTYKNLVQIGGAQNTFGFPGPGGIGQDFQVDRSVGQGAAPQVVAAGSFQAPATRGTYVLELANGFANVLALAPPPPTFTPVVRASVNVSSANFAFTVVGSRGDANCDGAVNAFDIDAFVLAVSNPAQYPAQHPQCDIRTADVNCDGVVNTFDIDRFVLCLTGGCPDCP